MNPPLSRAWSRWRGWTRGFVARLMLLYAALFLVSILALVGVTYWVGVGLPLREIEQTLASEADALAGVATAEGKSGLLVRLETRSTGGGQRAWHALVSPSGDVLVSNLRDVETTGQSGAYRTEVEFSARTADGGTEDDDHDALVLERPLPNGDRLLLARDIEAIEAREELLMQASVWVTGLSLLLGLAGGAAVSRAVSRRLGAVNRTARLVADGDLSSRVPRDASGDEFDRLAATLNLMLARIEEGVQAISRVSDSVAHELRTPLARLRADLETLVAALEMGTSRTDGDAAGEMRQRATRLADVEMAQSSLSEAEQLSSTFDALLRIARIETGRHSAGMRSVDLTPLVEDAADLYEPAAAERDQRIEVTVKSNLQLRADPDLLFQAVSNLLDNATKHGPSGGVISLDVQSHGETIEMAVTDEGPGIPPDQREKVTERFYRVPGRESLAGLGLGLSLVDVVARLHGGRLVLEDIPSGPGLRAALRLPAASGKKGRGRDLDGPQPTTG